jgi:hypothetical protein
MLIIVTSGCFTSAGSPRKAAVVSAPATPAPAAPAPAAPVPDDGDPQNGTQLTGRTHGARSGAIQAITLPSGEVITPQ